MGKIFLEVCRAHCCCRCSIQNYELLLLFSAAFMLHPECGRRCRAKRIGKTVVAGSALPVMILLRPSGSCAQSMIRHGPCFDHTSIGGFKDIETSHGRVTCTLPVTPEAEQVALQSPACRSCFTSRFGRDLLGPRSSLTWAMLQSYAVTTAKSGLPHQQQCVQVYTD